MVRRSVFDCSLIVCICHFLENPEGIRETGVVQSSIVGDFSSQSAESGKRTILPDLPWPPLFNHEERPV